MTERIIHFGDVVRVRTNDETSRLGLAGKQGSVHGETMPTITGISTIGEAANDFAVNVFFEDLEVSHWFAEDMLELVDHGAGAELRLDGVAKKWVRQESGEWVEFDLDGKPKRPWWKFW